MFGKRKAPPKGTKPADLQGRRELLAFICIVLALVDVISWFPTDAFLIKPFNELVGCLFGRLGQYLYPFALLYSAVTLFSRRKRPVALRVTCALTLVPAISALYQLLFSSAATPAELWNGGPIWESAGLIPGGIALLLSGLIGKVLSFIVFLVVIVLELLAMFGITPRSIIVVLRKRQKEEPEDDEAATERLLDRMAEHRRKLKNQRQMRSGNMEDFDIPVDEPQQKKKKKSSRAIPPDEFIKQEREREREIERKKAEAESPFLEAFDVEDGDKLHHAVVQKPAVDNAPDSLKKEDAATAAQEIAQEIESSEKHLEEYVVPPTKLLTLRKQNNVDATAEMRDNSRRLADTLKSFGIEPHIVDVIRGPSVTRYELELDRGVKLSKITNLADDIALSLGATGVRISAIPEKISVVGIEVPNRVVTTVFGREVIDSPAFRNSKSKVSFAVGKDISGTCIVGDIAKLPHMLIAGTTGSGKSVCMNTIILSLLYKAKPDEVKLIMIDPKMVELGIYNGIPHLLIPVVTDPKKAAGALQWAVTEMMKRYRLMSEEGVRDLDSYNKAIWNDPDQQAMPQIVVVIDELADLMLVAAKEVEESICRIAQMGRASGIHLVIATQRPSADVITGLMKANIPSRIAFAVSSAMESRIILDTPGAEKLVGKGDMLFAPLGQGKPKRVQGCFITDEEVQSVVEFIKAQSSSAYSTEIMDQINKSAEQSGRGGSSGGAAQEADSDGDELLPAAVEVILETGQASVSMLQRRLKLGYARAARIVDEMEERGIVGPFEGAKPRQLLITREQWEEMRNSGLPGALQ